MTALQEKTLKIANRLVGIKEDTGKNDGPFLYYIQDYVADMMGMSEASLENQPWCAIFVTWCVDQAAYLLKVKRSFPVHCSSEGLYKWAKAHGSLLPGPVPGCIGLLRGDVLSGQGNEHIHTFLVESLEGPLVITIDGNEGDRIEKTSHPINLCDFIEIT